MKSSNKQRRAQLQRQRLARAQNWPTRLAQAANAQEARALIAQAARQGVGVALADQAVLAQHNNATFLPGYYIDQPFHLLPLRRARGVDRQAAKVVVRSGARPHLQRRQALPCLPRLRVLVICSVKR